MKHTPGPWHACQNGKCVCKQVWSDDYPVAQVECGKWGDDYPSLRIVGGSLERKVEAFMDQITYGEISEDVAEANARLIAAAPELLEACRAMDKADSPETIDAAYVLIRKAIAKAEGVEP